VKRGTDDVARERRALLRAGRVVREPRHELHALAVVAVLLRADAELARRREQPVRRLRLHRVPKMGILIAEKKRLAHVRRGGTP